MKLTRKELAEQKRLQQFHVNVQGYYRAWDKGKMTMDEVVMAIIKLISHERNPWVKRQMSGVLFCVNPWTI